ncbi:MAG: ribonuclease P protein component [Alphaproteobacteria bacterium]|nr:ribonuclease P protein component [Alphaproteobacteria bacterium]
MLLRTITLDRLRKRADFLRVTRQRNSAGMPGLVLQAAPSGLTPKTVETVDGVIENQTVHPDKNKPAGGGDGARIGFTASRKVGNAVARKRAQRRLRAVSAAVMTQHAMPGRDYVLIARQTTPTRDYSALRGDLERALKRLKLWR